MGAMVSQITNLTIVYSAVHSEDERKHQSSASLGFVRRIHQWPVNSPHVWPVTQKMLPFDDCIMKSYDIGPRHNGTRLYYVKSNFLYIFFLTLTLR